MITREITLYETWYDFKHELQRRSGIVILNKTWLNIKPAAALPWHENQMKEALRRLTGKILKLKACPRCSGSLILDRDSDGFYKKCVQCSFEVEVIPSAVSPKV